MIWIIIFLLGIVWILTVYSCVQHGKEEAYKEIGWTLAKMATQEQVESIVGNPSVPLQVKRAIKRERFGW